MEKEFIALINQYPGILYKVCRVFCREEEDRSDLFQEIILQLWRAFPAFKHEANASTWMYRIAMNTAISIYRKDQRNQRPTPFSHLPFPLADFPEHTDSSGNMAQLYQAIDQLTVVEKAVVMLYLDDKSYDEMAQILGISKSNVGVKLNRIRTKLEKLIKNYSQLNQT